MIDAIVEFVSPTDGSLDAEASQRAISASLSDLLEEYDGVDLGALSADQIHWVMERHLVYEIHYRIQLDVGKKVQDRAPSPAAAIRRFNEILEYVQEAVASAFRARRASDAILTTTGATKLAQTVLEDTFAVFEEYVL